VVLDTWDSDPTVESVRGGVHRAGITGSPDTLLRILLRSSGSGTPFPAASCDRAERTSTGDRGCPPIDRYRLSVSAGIAVHNRRCRCGRLH